MENTSFVQTMKNAGLYKPAGKIEEQSLTVVSPNGQQKEYIMAQIDYSDLQVLSDETEVMNKWMDPFEAALWAKNAVGISNMIRVVNKQTLSGFKGSTGSGRQLDMVKLRAEQFQDPDQAGILVRTSWLRNIAAAATLQFITAQDALGANTHGALITLNIEGFFILGFVNPAAAPAIDAIQITYIGVPNNIQNLDFDIVNNEFGDPIVELKQPLFVYNNENVLISVRYYKNGADETRPIGGWVKMAQNLRAPATS